MQTITTILDPRTDAAKTKAMAIRFARELRKELTRGEFREVIRRNSEDADYASPNGSCASHDFCDANMVMDAAFKALDVPTYVDLQEGDGNEETPAQLAALELWNAAWAEAKMSGFAII